MANQKGGVGKTTTVLNLGAFRALAGRRVLVVDVDPQANATSGLGVRLEEGSATLYDVMVQGAPARSAIVPTAVAGLELLPASVDLAGAEVELVNAEERERRLERALGEVRGDFDEIYLDCPPSLGLLTINALTAADRLLVPLQCEYYALEGIGRLMETMRRVQSSLNPRLTLYGVLLTMFDGRTNLSIQVADEVKRHFRSSVFRTVIPRTVRLSEAPSHGQPISAYAPGTRAAEVYRELAQEVDERG